MIRAILLRFALTAYVLLTGAAFLFTMTRVRVPWIPSVLLEWSYGMMAPYQGDDSWNEDLIAIGVLDDGTEEHIDLDPYFPTEAGERSVRKHLRTFKPAEGAGPESYREAYVAFGRALLVRERLRGSAFSKIRLLWHEWPRSPAGFAYLHLPLFTEETFITEVP